MKSLFTTAALALACSACAGNKDELTKQLDDVRREVVALRATSSALQDRLDVLESGATTAAEEEKPVANDRPSLEVVHLSPSDLASADEAPAEEPIPVAPPPVDDSPPVVLKGDENGVETVEEAPKAATKPKNPWAGIPKKGK